MSQSSANLALPALPEELACEVSREVLPWLVAGLGGRLFESDGLWICEWPDGADEHGRVRRVVGPLADWCWGGEAFRSLREAFHAEGAAPNAQPCNQPGRVHEISEQLLAPYEADGGRVHLGGCTMEWLPLWVIFSLDDAGQPSGEQIDAADGTPQQVRLRREFLDAAGESVETTEVECGDFDHLTLLPSSPSAVATPPEPTPAAILCLPVWRSWVRGRVVAEIGEASLTVDVAGWATEIAAGKAELPPFDIGCGLPSHRVTLDEEDDIGPDAAIVACAESGRRLLCSKMQRCGSSDVWVQPKHILACPVTGVRVRESELAHCNMCCQPVAPQAISSGRCQVCRKLQTISKEDAQVARIIGEFPHLDQYGGWRIGESRDCYVLTAGRFLWRLLIVVRKDPFELAYAATGLRWIRGWAEASEELKRELRSVK